MAKLRFLLQVLCLTATLGISAFSPAKSQVSNGPRQAGTPEQAAPTPTAKGQVPNGPRQTGSPEQAAPTPAKGQAPSGPPQAGTPEPTEETPTVHELDAIQASLGAIEKSLERQHLSDADLQGLRGQIDPLSARAQDAIAALTPRLASIKVRLEQLGPKPDDKANDGVAPAESPSVTAERADHQKALNEIDEGLKRARLITVQAEQMSASITARRRALFARSLFERATSILSPTLWPDVWREVPRHAQAVQAAFSEWLNGVNGRLDGWSKPAFWGTLALIGLLYWPLAHLARGVLARNGTLKEPTQFRKILGAWWVALSIVIPPVATMAAAGLAFVALGLSNGRLEPFIEAVAIGVVRVSLAFGITRGLFAPTRPNWRLLHRTDAVSAAVVSLAVWVTSIVSVIGALEALNEIVGASLAFSVATRGLGAVAAAIALIAGLWRLGGAVRDDDSFGPPVAQEHDIFMILRFSAWPITLAVILAALIGYQTFASFLIDQIVWAGAVVCVLFMSTVLVDEVAGTLTRPSNRLGNRLMASIGATRSSFEVLGVVVSGLLRLALFAVAAALLVAPWGIRSSDFSFDLRSAFFGFQVGDVTISPANIIVAVALFGFAYALAHAVVKWVDKSLLPVTKLDTGLGNSINTSLGYIGFIVAASLALGYLGLGVEKLALVAGALSVGIGFGLQSIVNNFVSGLILLWERAVRVGDWIVVGPDQGFVRRINVRSTEIETFDRSQVIIPNSSLVTGVVKNLVRNDRTGRLVIPLSVSGSANPEKVQEVLFATAKAHELVLKMPAPQILFTGMSATALDFELRVFIADVETMFRVKSDLHFEIFKRFTAEKFFFSPGPDPTKVEIAGFDNLAAFLRPDRDPMADRRRFSAQNRQPSEAEPSAKEASSGR